MDGKCNEPQAHTYTIVWRWFKLIFHTQWNFWLFTFSHRLSLGVILTFSSLVLHVHFPQSANTRTITATATANGYPSVICLSKRSTSSIEPLQTHCGVYGGWFSRIEIENAHDEIKHSEYKEMSHVSPWAKSPWAKFNLVYQAHRHHTHALTNNERTKKTLDLEPLEFKWVQSRCVSHACVSIRWHEYFKWNTNSTLRIESPTDSFSSLWQIACESECNCSSSSLAVSLIFFFSSHTCTFMKYIRYGVTCQMLSVFAILGKIRFRRGAILIRIELDWIALFFPRILVLCGLCLGNGRNWMMAEE